MVSIRSLAVALLMLAGLSAAVEAQSRRPAPAARPVGKKPAEPAKIDRGRLQTPELRVQKISPELQQVLDRWEQATAHITTLEGEILRYYREFVYMTEKRSRGEFFYKALDKGRLDIQAITIAKGTTVKVKGPPRRNRKTNRLEPGSDLILEVKSDRPEKWICDGVNIVQINDAERTYERFPIPREYRGRNIMDGPLPFLFGMPAAKAVKRYRLELLGQTSKEVWLRAWPRWQQDAANYREATVVLDRSTYLPRHVRLVAPDGSQTIFSFSKLKVNSRFRAIARLWPGGDPFRPNLSGYQLILKPSRTTVPLLIGLPWQNAKNALDQKGYKVRFTPGKLAKSRNLLYVVYEQKPREGEPLEKGQVVRLTFYTKPGGR